jgi:hypothetical protein
MLTPISNLESSRVAGKPAEATARQAPSAKPAHPATPADGVQLSARAQALAAPRRHRTCIPQMRPGDLPPMFTAHACPKGSQKPGCQPEGANRTRRPKRRDENSIRSQIAAKVEQMWSSVAKAISSFSKALVHLPKHKQAKLRAIIEALRGFGGVADAIRGGNIKAAVSAAKSFGVALKEVAKRSRAASGLRFAFRRAGAFVPLLGTVLEGDAARRALLKADQAKKAGKQGAAGIWGGAAALHTLAATFSGTVDLVLLLSGGTCGPAYAVMNGVVSGLGAVGDIAGELAD